MIEIPDWLEKLLDREGPFKPDTFDDDKTEAKPITSENVMKPRIDLSKFFASKGMKYTCSFCEGEFQANRIRKWWRKPGNKYGTPSIPICPLCGNAGAIPGWGVDWSERRKLGEQVRKEEMELSKLRQKLKEQDQ